MLQLYYNLTPLYEKESINGLIRALMNNNYKYFLFYTKSIQLQYISDNKQSIMLSIIFYYKYNRRYRIPITNKYIEDLYWFFDKHNYNKCIIQILKWYPKRKQLFITDTIKDSLDKEYNKIYISYDLNKRIPDDVINTIYKYLQ